MPLDVLKQIDEEKKALSDSGDNSELLDSLTEIQEKAGKSSEVLSVLNSIIRSMTSSGRELHDCIGDVVKDFEAYDKIASSSRKETASLSAEYAALGANGVLGIHNINDGLTHSLSLLKLVEREVKKFDRALSGVHAPSIDVPSPRPIQKFANGGQIKGGPKIGDKNLVRVNAGEWIFNEKQMNVLKKKLGASSATEVFRMAGGLPGRARVDCYGTQMFDRGGTVQDIKQQIHTLEVSMSNATSDKDKAKYGASIKQLESLNKLIESLSDADFDVMHIESDVKKIFTSIQNGTKDVSDSVRDLELTARKLSQYSGNSLKYATGMEDANKRLKNARSQSAKNDAQRDLNSNKLMLSLSQQRYLTRDQQAARSDIETRFNSATTTAQREAIASEVQNFSGADDLNRKIGLGESLSINMQMGADKELEIIKSTLGGMPQGIAAVSVAFGLAAKAAADLVNKLSGTVESTAKLTVESARLKASFDSVFGNGNYDSLRKELGLTRSEMTELAPLMTDAYRDAGVQMEHVAEVARNIREEFGAMDPKMLNEALAVMKDLTSDQMDILLKGDGSSNDRASMYTNLMKSGNAGKAADLLEQGIFGGENLSANISEGDKAIIENLQMIKRVEETGNVMLKDGFGMFSSSIPLAKVVSATVGISGTAIQMATSLLAIKMLLAQKKGEDATKNIGNLGGMGGMKGLGAGLLATAITTAFVVGFDKLAGHFEEKKEVKEAKKEKERNDIYGQTGIYASEADMKVDMDAVNARGAKYASYGAGIGGVAGGVAGGFSGSIVPFAGTAAGVITGAAGGAAAGGAAGYGIGAGLEYKKQLGDKANNTFLKKIDGEYNIELIESTNKITENLSQIKKNTESARKSEVKSLRMLESTGIVVKKVKSGAHTSFFDRQVESAQKNIDAMGVMGGNAAEYGGNVSTILNNASASFSKNMDELVAEQQYIMNKEGITAEARATATREVLDEQAAVTKKFCDTVYNSIGEYDKIPEIIQKSLQSKINSMVLNMNMKNMVGTSSMNSNRLKDNLKNANDSLVKAIKQYYNEQPEIKKAEEKANENMKVQSDNYKSNQEQFSTLGFQEVVDEKGNINADAITKNQSIIKKQKEQLDQEIKDKTKIGNYEHTERMMNKLMGGSKTWKEFEDQLGGMDKTKWEANKNSYIEKMIAALEADNEALEAIINDKDIDSKYREQAKSSKGVYESTREQLLNLRDKPNLFTIEQAKDIKGLISGNAQIAATSFLRDKSAVENDKNIKNRKELLGKAESALAGISSANDNKVMVAKNAEKSLSGLMNVVNSAHNAAEQMIAQLENDPTLNFYKAQEANLAAQKDYLMSTGGYSKYLTGELENMSSQLASQRNVVGKLRENFTKQRTQYQEQAQGILNKGGMNKKVKGVVEQLNELNTLREKAYNDPSLNSEVEAKEQQINAEINKLPPEFKQEAEKAVMLLSASNAALYKIQEEESKTRSMQFAQFKKMIDLMGEYKNTIEYMSVESNQGRITSQSNLAYANLDIGKAGELAAQARAANTEKYNLDIKGIEEGLSNQLKKLDSDEKLARESGDTAQLEAIQKEKGIINNKAEQSKAEAILEYQKKQVEAAKMEYDVKMKTVDLANRSIDIQMDLAQTIGAPMETIVQLERQRVQKAKEALEYAEEQYNNMLESGATQEEIEEAKLNMQKAQAQVIKDSLGAQRSMMEKVFGNMIGAFSEVAGIMGPNNIAGKYGMGYMTDGSGGNVRKSDGTASGGYRDRVFAASAGGGTGALGAAERDSSIPGGSTDITVTGNASGDKGTSAPNQATGTTKNDGEFNSLGEKFKDEKEGIEVAVFWEKKIYNLLEEKLRKNGVVPDKKEHSIPLSPIEAGNQNVLYASQEPAANPVGNQVIPQTENQNILPQPVAEVNHSEHGNSDRKGRDSPDASSSQKINVEVAVKFNNTMFENQITRVVTSPSVSRSIVSNGMEKS